MDVSSSVIMRPGSLWIKGRPEIVLSSSLFYFRIPAAEWRSRMRTVRALGYNAIDTYFPWNYHQVAPGQWDFSGERDARVFLELAHAEGLWVIARPGPYICSEWDGGALPAHLAVQDGMYLRDACPPYLAAVRGWYDHIMPLLAGCQLDRGGAVVMVQLENELDFFDCADRVGLMAALRDMALAHGITVPLVACAGQGDLAGATGDVEGIVPACNFYFDGRSPEVERVARHYEQRLRELGFPLCVTETNRSHTDLRRLIAGGAKLVGPYLQAGGCDFGFTTSVTNWGEPLSFMTAYYDFGGMISPGGMVRPAGQEALLLARMVAALGPALALSTPQPAPPLPVHGVEAHALALDGGGYLVGLPNPGETVARVTAGAPAAQFPVRTALDVPPYSCPFVLLDYPLFGGSASDWRIVYATAELMGRQQEEHDLQLVFAIGTGTGDTGIIGTSVELLIEMPAATVETATGWQMERAQGGWRLWTAGALPAEAAFAGAGGKRLVVKALSRAEITDLRSAGVEESLIVGPSVQEDVVDSAAVRWVATPVDSCGQAWFAQAKVCPPGQLHCEENGVWRGFGWYRSDDVRRPDVQGFLVCGGADVLSLFQGGHFLRTVVPGGGEAYIPLPQEVNFDAAEPLVVRAEIWGHSNFDDHRLPALRLQSLRGMRGLAAVRRVQNVTAPWFYQHKAQEPAAHHDSRWPYSAFGGWSSTDEPLRGVYYRSLACEEGMDACLLQFAGLQATAHVFVDEQPAGLVNPYNPYVDLSRWLSRARPLEIAVAMEHDYRRPAGQVWLYQGEWIQEWRLAQWDEQGLAELAHRNQAGAMETHFPMRLSAGEMAWLHGQLPRAATSTPGFNLQLAGKGIKAALLVGRRLVGRIWLPSETRPRMTGGADDRLVLPASWLHEANGELHLLVESVEPGAVLESIRFVHDR